MINRREALQLLASATALQLAPRSLRAAVREARALVNVPDAPRTLSPHHFATVKTMAEMILPRTDTPGAADVGVAEFIDLMLTEWYDAPERERFTIGCDDVDMRTRKLFGKDFVDCSADQQAEMLRDLGERMIEELDPERKWLEADAESAPEARENFYAMLRRLTLTGYYTSEAGATDELHFQIIPDRHAGCAAEQGAPTEKQ